MPAPRVLLADDHHLLLGALEKLLQEDCQIVGRVSDGHALVAAAQQLKPDVIVLDVAMPLLNGLEAGRQIKQLLRSVKLIYVTMNEDPDIAAEAFRVGASAYLLKRSTPVELLTAIREVMLGRSYVTPLVTEQLVESLLKVEEHKAGQELTSRQREILQLVAEGPFDEGDRRRSGHYAAHGGAPQVPADGPAPYQVDGGARSVRRQAQHGLRATVKNSLTRITSFGAVSTVSTVSVEEGQE